MLTEIRLQNFKCFRENTKIPFQQINLLTGINGRGKSTTLQALLLMRQSPDYNQATDHIIFNGSCVNLGNFDDVRNSATPRDEPIELAFQFESGDDSLFLRYMLDQNEQDEMVASIKQINVTGQVNEISVKAESSLVHEGPWNLLFVNTGIVVQFTWSNLLFEEVYGFAAEQPEMDLTEPDLVFRFARSTIDFRKIHYISADRVGPQDYYPKQSFSTFPHVGVRGEFTANLLSRKKNDQVHSSLCLDIGVTQTVLDQTEAWLDTIFGGGRIHVEQTRANIVLMSLNSERASNMYKPLNVGFGYSYALPILVSGLIAQSGEMLIVENPEAHLHPSAQSQLTKFLAKVSQTGVQVFIESHSDHVLNALRVAVVDKIITADELNVLYFDRNIEQNVKQIPVNTDGSIEYWPAGFFDQTDKDFERLFGL